MAWKFELKTIASHGDRGIIYSTNSVIAIQDKYPKVSDSALNIVKAPLVSFAEDDFGGLSVPAIFWTHISSEGNETDGWSAYWVLLQRRFISHWVPRRPIYSVFFAFTYRQLHMHVISSDFQGPFMKTKRHWNSFTTPFFVSFDFVLRSLETNGRVDLDCDSLAQYLELPLRCTDCSYETALFSSLMAHIKQH